MASQAPDAGASHTQPADKFATINGLQIHYLEWGTAGKQPLILLHGVARTAHTFDHVAPHFTGHYHVIAVDMRGHGDSAWHAQSAYTVEDYTSDIEALIEHLELRNIAMWGASTGGRVAQMIAGLHPDWVSSIIVEDVGAERPPTVSNRRGARMAKEANGWATLDEMLVQIRIENPRASDAILRHLAQHGSKVRSDGRRVWKRDPEILKGFVPTDLWATVGRIKAPILYVVGGVSTTVPPLTQLELQRVLPHAKLVSMPGLGHYPSDEKPEDFLAIADRFLAGAKKS
jgi:pimeloyl-ACP methyl ester carboxylesterase